jgi:hypothetical protein
VCRSSSDTHAHTHTPTHTPMPTSPAVRLHDPSTVVGILLTEDRVGIDDGVRLNRRGHDCPPSARSLGRAREARSCRPATRLALPEFRGPRDVLVLEDVASVPDRDEVRRCIARLDRVRTYAMALNKQELSSGILLRTSTDADGSGADLASVADSDAASRVLSTMSVSPLARPSSASD